MTGLGGLFFKAKDPRALGAWYRKHLGLEVGEPWSGCCFAWRDAKNPRKQGTTVWSLFEADTKYFGRGRQGHRVNHRVANLKKVLAALKKEGVWIDPKQEVAESGRFA